MHWSGWAKLRAIAATFATLGASVTAVAALWFSGQSLKVSTDGQSLAEETATTARFQLAAEQLANDQVNVRVSGIYLLERIAKESPADHPTVFGLLTSFLRTHAHNEVCNAYFTDVPGVEPPGFDPAATRKALPTDVETALTVISRRDITHDDPVNTLDLGRACLPEVWDSRKSGPDSAAPQLGGVNLTNAVLVGAHLDYAHLAEADLSNADLTVAILGSADLTRADLVGAELVAAILIRANLTEADLFYADLESAFLTGANLTRADLHSANLTKADLSGADLSGADLTGIIYDSNTRWPEGFVPPPSA
ncbi:pentapeptide repeat-containing protein [Nocardia sienata]|uniref:pentapeptide repeat-containing protein n=1 Tax=Nocardia sienata TaxID=248552 RepID=UPI0007A3E8EC|nr:pentapeptide repeat-containing protein [Nocardia sienata]